MRNITSTQQEILNSNERKVVQTVKIYRNDYPDTPINITSRVEDIRINYDLNSRNATCQLTIDNSDYTYSPHNRNSNINQVNSVYNPLLYPNHKVEIFAGFETSQGNEEWQLFTGITGDEINTQTIPGKILMTIRDMSKRLQDKYVYLSQSYDYQLAEDVIQGLLNEFGFTDINLIVSEPTNYVIQHYQIKDSNLWDGLQKIADLMGWILMFNYKGDLIFKKVNDGSSPAKIFGENEFIREEINITDADIRNVIKVKVQTPDGVIDVELRDQSSIDEFGERFMEVDRDLSSMIHTYEQAFQLASAILRDLAHFKEPYTLPLPLYPPIELDDIVASQSSKTGLEGTELFKVVGIEHQISATSKRTVLNLQSYIPPEETTGKIPNPPSGLIGEIISREINNYPNSGWTGNTKTVYYPKISFTKPTQNTDGTALDNLAGYLVARSTTSSTDGFIQLKSVPAFDAQGNDRTFFIDYSAPAGNCWYKMAAINTQGRISSYSGMVQVTVPTVNIS